MAKPKVRCDAVGLVKPGPPRTDVLVNRSSGGKPPRRRIRHQLYDAPPPGGVVLATTPLSAPAREVFAGAEYEAHMLAACRRVRRRKGSTRAQCWACGKWSPNATRPDKCGWVSREMPGYPATTEIYCKACFARWGWPPVPGETVK